MSAAALSAAVDSYNFNGECPTFRGILFGKKDNSNPSRFPGGSAREGKTAIAASGG